MSALSDLQAKDFDTLTELEKVIVRCGESAIHPLHQVTAARDLAALTARVAELEDTETAKWANAHTELGKKVAAYEEFVSDMKETLEMHESHWSYHLHKCLDELAAALQVQP